MRLAALVLAASGICGTAFAQAPAPLAPAASAESTDPVASALPATDVDDLRLAAFVDGVVESFRQRDKIAGVTVAIVRDDRLALLKGYGFADLAPERAVVPDQTLFRIASISKTFVYTAAMQLVERGKLSLDDEVNRHLPEALQVPDQGFREPIRVRHLFTHTAGFEDSALGHLFVDDPANVLPLDEYLATQRPHRVREAGTQADYSNYSLGLLGAVVAQVSGERFEDYIERHLTGPLGMARTTFREPALSNGDPRRLDPALANAISTGFERKGGAWSVMPFEHIAQIAPAGGASSTAADMARWMRMHLRGGELDGARVLGDATARGMRDVLFRNAQGVNGIAHGFVTDRIGTHFTYGHGGATLFFHSQMVLVPDLNLGVFVSTNTDTGRRFAAEFPTRLIEFLDPGARPQTVPAFAVDPATLNAYAGIYLTNRRPYRSAEKLLVSIGSGTLIVTVADGALQLITPIETLRLLPTGPRTFVEADGHRRFEFLPDTQGLPAALAGANGLVVADRAGWLQQPNTLILLLAASALTALFSLRGMFARRRKRASDRFSPRQRPGLAAVTTLSTLTALSWLAVGALAVVAGSDLLNMGSAVMFRYPTPGFTTWLAACTLAAALTAGSALATVPVWRSRWHWRSKLSYSIGIVVFVLTVWTLWNWNLIGINP